MVVEIGHQSSQEKSLQQPTRDVEENYKAKTRKGDDRFAWPFVYEYQPVFQTGGKVSDLEQSLYVLNVTVERYLTILIKISLGIPEGVTHLVRR